MDDEQDLGENSDLNDGVARRMGAERMARAREKRERLRYEERLRSELGPIGSYALIGFEPVTPEEKARGEGLVAESIAEAEVAIRPPKR